MLKIRGLEERGPSDKRNVCQAQVGDWGARAGEWTTEGKGLGKIQWQQEEPMESSRDWHYWWDLNLTVRSGGTCMSSQVLCPIQVVI